MAQCAHTHTWHWLNSIDILCGISAVSVFVYVSECEGMWYVMSYVRHSFIRVNAIFCANTYVFFASHFSVPAVCVLVLLLSRHYRRHFIPGNYALVAFRIYRANTRKWKNIFFPKKYMFVSIHRRLRRHVCREDDECIWSNNIFAPMFSYNSTFYLIAQCGGQLMNILYRKLIWMERRADTNWARRGKEWMRYFPSIATHATGK